MSYHYLRPSYNKLILFFAVLKIILNLFAINHYGFNRDELLHLALGDHLSWGYMEVPPFIGLLGAIANHLLGGSLIATRIFPTIFAGLLVWVTGKLVVEMGGRRLAITLACLTMILSPAFAASEYLFQPVVFDQFWWALTALFLIKYINKKDNKYLYLTGVAVGLGILTKYTMIFFVVALLIGILISKHRKILLSKPFLVTLLIAFVIIIPNIIWQLTHHIPAITHMDKLQKQQLNYNKPSEFIISQLLINGVSLVVWLAGLAGFFASYKLRKFMFLGIAYLLVFAFLLIMHGKGYYLLPAYPMLFAAGAYIIEKLLKPRQAALRVTVLLLLTLPHFILFPVVLPLFPLPFTLNYIKELKHRIPAVKAAIMWEDHQDHPLTQDYADMLGWEEMVSKAAKAYQNLPKEEQQQTTIFTDNYGEAAAFFHFGPKYRLPTTISLNSSFALWAPANPSLKNMIYVSDDDDVSDLQPLSTSIEKIGEVTNPLAREKGTGIFLIKGLKPELQKIYEQHRREALGEIK